MQKAVEIMREVQKVVVGKERAIASVMCAMLAGGHILLEDIPGVGKTTMALAFARAMDLSFKRMQFTPDVMPSDVTGYSVFNRQKGESEYVPGAAMCNLFLADEINRTSSKTQSALLEVMEEGNITVDGVTRQVPRPFWVIATQNPVGSAGTQLLPESQMDRFMICLSMGYPDIREEVKILQSRQESNPLESVRRVAGPGEFLAMQQEAGSVFASGAVCEYAATLAAWTRSNEQLRLGVSPRGTLALVRMAKAAAYLSGKDYVVPENIQSIFLDVCAHRVLLSSKGRVAGLNARAVLTSALREVPAPGVG